jgi:oligopeptide/dipeptide ABC transporter ATP-binding protein
MRLLLRLERPSEGVVRFRGRDLATLDGPALREFRRGVQAVFQDPYSSLNPRLRVGVAVTEPLLAAVPGTGRAEARDRAAESLAAVGLPPEVAERLPHQLSGGQRQRVAIARALTTTPELMILDEPVSALDVSIRAQVTNLLLDIQQQRGIGYVLVAHDLALVRRATDDVVVMYLGRIIEAGPARSVLGSPGHPYTRALVANASMGTGGSRPGITLSGEMPSPLQLPRGCRFHPRCPLATGVCREADPPVVDLGGHSVACHHSERVPVPA